MTANIISRSLLVAIGFTVLCGGQTPGWKAEIESEGGIRVIVNPAAPRFGKLQFDLAEDLVLGNDQEKNLSFALVYDVKADDQGNILVLDSGNQRIQKFDRAGMYLQTIGRKGQGPGEFQRPFNLYLDRNGGIYVLESQKIHTFTPEGSYKRTIVIPSFLMDFVPDGEGNVFMTGYVRTEKGQDFGVLLVDDQGKKIRTIAEFPGLPFGLGGATISHDYSPDLRICAAGKAGFVYGYSPQYKLYCADWSGKSVLIIAKKEPSLTISRKKKDQIIDRYVKNTSRAGFGWSREDVERAANLPRCRPFFRGIMADDEGRIYVKKVQSVLEDSEDIEYDVFCREGFYLYSIRLPFAPMHIRAGYLYSTRESEETGEVKVTRYRIRNWGQIMAGLD